MAFLDMSECVEYLERFLIRFEALGCSTLPLTVQPPATEEDVTSVEAELGYRLPEELRTVFLTMTAGVEFWWNAYGEDKEILSLPGELAEICSGDSVFRCRVWPKSMTCAMI